MRAQGAIRGLTTTLARDLAPEIRVNALAPEPIQAKDPKPTSSGSSRLARSTLRRRERASTPHRGGHDLAAAAGSPALSAGLAALLDDVAALARAAAASVDDVAAGASRASMKAAGVIVDDAAVTPRYVQGFRPERELPMIKRIAVGSLRNKLLFILPAALAAQRAAAVAAHSDPDDRRHVPLLRGRREVVGGDQPAPPRTRRRRSPRRDRNTKTRSSARRSARTSSSRRRSW